jgi:hypothetical protein
VAAAYTSKNSNSKIAHKISEKIRETATTIFYLPRWFGSLSSRDSISSVIIIITVVDKICILQDLFLGLRRLAAEEGTFSKKTWLQKIKSGSW